MKAEFFKSLCHDKVFIFSGKTNGGMRIEAWVDLTDCMIYHSINGEVMALVFPTLDAFAKHIEEISEQ